MQAFDITPIQHTAPIPNNTDWYVIAGVITCGSALLAYGVSRNFARWEEELDLPEWFSVVGELTGITMGMLGGTLVGYLVWHWGLGALCATVGSWASPWFVHALTKYVNKKTRPD